MSGEETKRAAIYVRVSTHEQVQGYSIGEQKERLLAYCKAQGWLVAEVYVDGGYSGSNLDRPAMQRLIAEVAGFDVVLVYKLDRLSRSQRDTLHLIEDVFLPSKVDFVSMQESFDTSSPFGRAMVGLLAVFAQLEREQIKERLAMGREARAKAGLYHCGGKTPIGYDYDNGKLAVNPYEAEQVRKAFELYLSGMSMERIAEYMRGRGYSNRYGHYTDPNCFKRMLSNATYLGHTYYRGGLVFNTHEPIITREQFDAAQALRARRGEAHLHTQARGSYLLTGLVYCARCGARYFTRTDGRRPKHRYYSCYSRYGSPKAMVKDPDCKNRIWKMPELDAIVEERVRRLFSGSGLAELSEQSPKKTAPKPRKRDNSKRLAEIDRQIGKLMALYQQDNMPPELLGEQISKLYNEKKTLAVQAEEPPEASKSSFDIFKALVADAAQVWDGADIPQKRRVLQSLIRRIDLDGDDVRIEWNVQ